MDLTLRPANEQEQLYSFLQSGQISAQTGFLGWLRGDMGQDGSAFAAKWTGYGEGPQQDDCRAELYTVLETLCRDQAYGGFLQNRSALLDYCATHPALPSNGVYEGACYRADTARHTYIFLAKVKEPACPVSCMCYRRGSLDRHMAAAKQGIRFIDPAYNEQFRLEDGDWVRIVRGGEKRDYMCRYIDPNHLEVGRNPLHICEFAELMQRAGNKGIPLRRSLPRTCLSVLESTGELIKITLGEAGYEKADFPGTSDKREVADNINRAAGITKAQEAAMVCGSMFGWKALGADPKNYDAEGRPIPPRQHRDRGDAR